ncbi:MAG: flagellar assembly protein FliW [Deltaproteobacteria bacterium]|nr:flagellar assembly protein FliW [Deltaproteobacteria bacterium]
MTQIRTSRFGVVTLDETEIIQIKRGLIGFPQHTRFAVINPGPDSALFWLQSVDDPELAFVIASPYLFEPEYHLNFGPGVLVELEAEDPKDLVVYVLVTIPQGRPEAMTANLIGPLIINPRASLAEQLVVEESPYSHKHPIFRGRKEQNE